MEDPRHLLDPLVEQAESRGIREHQPRCPLAHLGTKIGEIEIPARVGLDLLQSVAGHGHARRIRPVGGIRNDDRVALLTAVREVSPHEHEARQLAL